MKALIVDDDLLVCKGLKKLIPWTEFGFDEVLEAHNGKDAYDLAIQHSPDIIISDISMPLMDGLTFCEKMFKAVTGSPIILLSAYENFEYARTAMKYGVTHYLLKPINKSKMDELKTIIKELIAQKTDRTESLTVFGGDIERSIVKAVTALDDAFLQDLFESKLHNMGIDNSEKKVVYIALINLLFSCYENESTAEKYVRCAKETALQQLVQMQSAARMERYVETLYLDAIKEMRDRMNGKDDVIIRQVKDYIAQNYANADLSVAFLSETFFVSSSYLGSIFKTCENTNLSTYITEFRMKKACELLKKPFIKVAEVAVQTGYHDPLYFAKVFKKAKGITPSEYQCLHV
ncbi:MAG: response regulator [Ruthenibacterium sp.]